MRREGEKGLQSDSLTLDNGRAFYVKRLVHLYKRDKQVCGHMTCMS